MSLPVTIDDNSNRQQLLPSSGVRQVGQWGNGPLEFWCPCGLTITRNNEYLIVVDSWNHRLQVSYLQFIYVEHNSQSCRNIQKLDYETA